MGASTTAKQTRSEQCRKNAQAKSEQKRQATLRAIQELQQEHCSVTRMAVAKRAGVSVVFLRSHPDLLQAIEEVAQRYRLTPPEIAADKTKDQVIAALRRRLEDVKLAAASPLTDGELRQTLQEVLQRLANLEEEATKRSKTDVQGG